MIAQSAIFGHATPVLHNTQISGSTVLPASVYHMSTRDTPVVAMQHQALQTPSPVETYGSFTQPSFTPDSGNLTHMLTPFGQVDTKFGPTQESATYQQLGYSNLVDFASQTPKPSAMLPSQKRPFTSTLDNSNLDGLFGR